MMETLVTQGDKRGLSSLSVRLLPTELHGILNMIPCDT